MSTGPDQLEPYTVRLRLIASANLDPSTAVAAFLEEVARTCDEAGASIIGHLKCHGRLAGGGRFHCNLTSLRSGAHCSDSPEQGWPPGEELELDLAVLVYGLPRDIVERSVQQALERLQAQGVTALDVPRHHEAHHRHEADRDRDAPHTIHLHDHRHHGEH